MKSTKLTSKFQATIPKDVRDRLKLKAGDSILFQVLKDGTIILKKALPFDKAYLQAVQNTLTEWESQEDDQAFADLQNL